MDHLWFLADGEWRDPIGGGLRLDVSKQRALLGGQLALPVHQVSIAHHSHLIVARWASRFFCDGDLGFLQSWHRDDWSRLSICHKSLLGDTYHHLSPLLTYPRHCHWTRWWSTWMAMILLLVDIVPQDAFFAWNTLSNLISGHLILKIQNCTKNSTFFKNPEISRESEFFLWKSERKKILDFLFLAAEERNWVFL